MGDGSKIDKTTPVLMSGTNENVTSVVCGQEFTVVIMKGKIYSFGANGVKKKNFF